MGFSYAAKATALLLFFSLSVFVPISCASPVASLKAVDVENPVVDVTPTPISEYKSSSRGSKDVLLCERVRVAGISRLKLRSYASVYRVTVAPSATIPERIHGKIQICFHRNTSLGLCQCGEDWKALQKGVWSSVTSPYEDRYVDVKFVGEISGSVAVTVEEEFQQWRLLCLAIGLVLMLLAPIVSNWVPFYYSSSMAIGVLLVIIILLFQGMKLLPTGRKSAFYLTIYGSVLGAGSFLVHYFSLLVNSVLVNFGLSEEMHNPVSVFLLIGIILAGAALGYWLVRKFVISENGSVDAGIAQFVKWAMRVVAVTFIFQSTLDTSLAMAALVSCLAVCIFITSLKWDVLELASYYGNGSIWVQSGGQQTAKHNRAEFFSRSGKMGACGTMYNSPRGTPAWSNSPVKGLVSPSSRRRTRKQEDFYSTFHKTPDRKEFSKKDWEDFTQESTQKAVADLASSPEFTSWIIKNADRIHLLPEDSSDETIRSESDSTDENIADSGSGIGLLKWQRQK